MAEIIIAKHRNGAVGDVLLRFKGEYARFQNPDDDMIIPMPGEELKGSRLNSDVLPSPPPDTSMPPEGTPFDIPPTSGPLPF